MDEKKNRYLTILVIVNQVTKKVHYETLKTTINIASLAKILIVVLVRHYGLFESIICNGGLLFNSKFWYLLCYIFIIKQKVLLVFHLQTNDQTEKQNSEIEIYLYVFVN